LGDAPAPEEATNPGVLAVGSSRPGALGGRLAAAAGLINRSRLTSSPL